MWNGGDKIALFSLVIVLVIAIIAIVASSYKKEIKEGLGADPKTTLDPNASPTPPATQEPAPTTKPNAEASAPMWSKNDSMWSRNVKIGLFGVLIAAIAIIVSIYIKEIREYLELDPKPTPAPKGYPSPRATQTPTPAPKPSAEPPTPNATPNRSEPPRISYGLRCFEIGRYQSPQSKNSGWADARVPFRPREAYPQKVDVYGPPNVRFFIRIGNIEAGSTTKLQEGRLTSHAAINVFHAPTALFIKTIDDRGQHVQFDISVSSCDGVTNKPKK